MVSCCVVNAWDELRARLRDAATLASVAQLLGWDQETCMPASAGESRAEQLALVGRLAHERATHAGIGELLATCEADATLVADAAVADDLREIRRDWERGRRLPADLVAEAAATGSRALEAWREARRTSDFDAFAPWLERQLDIARRKAACWGAPDGGDAYDALLHEYEPGMTGAALDGLFAPLREELTPLIAAVVASSRRPARVTAGVEVPVPVQRELCAHIVAALGFDGDAGRLDESTHPFACGIAAGDTRITTRYGSGVLDAIGSTMHECGHALYEQGLPKGERHGLPSAEALGLGVHESQSRLWENHVGRSRPFWTWLGPLVRERCGLPDADDDALWAAANEVRPNLIRVESDEATYNLHVMLRFDLERALLRGDLAVADLPAAWNDRMRDDLGLEVPDDARGCLQDVHWAMGAIGYFPTYTLGTLYAAQLFEAAERDRPGLANGFAEGRFEPLLDWLRRSVHRHGRRVPAAELCRRVTGRDLDHAALLRHLRGTLSRLYDLG